MLVDKNFNLHLQEDDPRVVNYLTNNKLTKFFSNFFFFQAEDGIRALSVTGVQTCALPISSPLARRIARERGIDLRSLVGTGPEGRVVAEDVERAAATPAHATAGAAPLEAEVQKLSPLRRTIAR